MVCKGIDPGPDAGWSVVEPGAHSWRETGKSNRMADYKGPWMVLQQLLGKKGRFSACHLISWSYLGWWH